MSKELIYTRGLPGSSKSTWAKQFISDHSNYVRINMDDLRMMFFGKSVISKDAEKFMKKMRDILIIEALRGGKNVISDNVHLSPKSVAHINNLVAKFNKDNNSNVKVTEKSFLDVPLEECIKRDLARSKSVGEKVIREMHEQFIEKKCEPLVQNFDLPHIYLADIDGTVAKTNGRSPFDWSRVGEDLPKNNIINILHVLHKAGYSIIFFSGRDSICRRETEEWLNRYLKIPYELYMRPNGDSRKDSIIKRELFDKYIRDKYYVEAVFDDRDQVISLWRKEIGLTCLQVDYGNF